MESSNQFYNRGWEAYENNIMWKGNPYAFDSAEGWHWGTGWEDAAGFYDNDDDFEAPFDGEGEDYEN